MKATDFDFHLPEAFIAPKPVIPRDRCRLLVLHRDGSMEHRRFSHLPEYLHRGDLLLLNNTKVFPARLIGNKKTGGKIELLLVREIEPDVWEILSKKRYTGSVYVSEELSGEIFQGKIIRFTINHPKCNPHKQDLPHPSDLMKTLWKAGLMPLPPYIKRKPDEMDKEWYQTVYADKIGSIAAPTAGLHFTEELIAGLQKKGVIIRFLTLHVGIGTFKPIRVEHVENHTMDAEHFEIDNTLLETIKKVKESRKRVISVGTTTTRTIEGLFSGQWSNVSLSPHSPLIPSRMLSGFGRGRGGVKGEINHPSRGSKNGSLKGNTDIFIYPGYPFRVVDSLITNFHLPRSTPLMLTSALCGLKNLLNAYTCAISKGYRFFSYGDAMLIL